MKKLALILALAIVAQGALVSFADAVPMAAVAAAPVVVVAAALAVAAVLAPRLPVRRLRGHAPSGGSRPGGGFNVGSSDYKRREPAAESQQRE